MSNVQVLSADRYVAVCHPISSPRFRTGVIAKIVSLSVWLISGQWRTSCGLYFCHLKVDMTSTVQLNKTYHNNFEKISKKMI